MGIFLRARYLYSCIGRIPKQFCDSPIRLSFPIRLHNTEPFRPAGENTNGHDCSRSQCGDSRQRFDVRPQRPSEAARPPSRKHRQRYCNDRRLALDHSCSCARRSSGIIISQWRDSASITSMQNDARMRAYFPKIAALAAFDSTPGAVSYTRRA